ncbi:hypothetical protein ANO11243_026000 [Dothideomycetidae sp. 11243]|nr:hypothetical protein ANO11243_026000 [fungal sp. No.11243]
MNSNKSFLPETEELAAIESRLRETEARLARMTGSAQLPPATMPPVQTMPVRDPPVAHHNAFAVASYDQAGTGAALDNKPAPQVQKSPPNVRQDSLGLPPMSGAFPITPMDQRGNDYVGQNR